MDPLTVDCEVCGRPAIIHSVRYQYDLDGEHERFADRHILRELHSDIECPTCGRRMQVETVKREGED